MAVIYDYGEIIETDGIKVPFARLIILTTFDLRSDITPRINEAD